MRKMGIRFKGTKHDSFLLSNYEHYRGIFEATITEINEALKDFPYFDGIDFSDVGANGIQIRGHHELIPNRTYGHQSTISYDLTNITEATQEFIDSWKALDKPQKVAEYKNFLAMGDKYGWD